MYTVESYFFNILILITFIDIVTERR